MLNKETNVRLAAALLLAISGALTSSGNMSSIRQGKSSLLKYLRDQSAVQDKTSPCEENNTLGLKFHYRHYEVLSVDEVDQAVYSVGYVNMSWVDPDLVWNKADYGGVDMISLPYDELWHPVMIVTNAADPDYLRIDRTQTLGITSDGTVTYVTPVYLKTLCDLDLKLYPFDSQKCQIVFMPFIDDVKFSLEAETISDLEDHFLVNGQWRISEKKISVTTLDYRDNLQMIAFTMVIERRYMYYIVCVLCPMVLTSSVTSIVFCIPARSGEKISFLVTVFASNAIFLNFIAGTMPRNMSKLPFVTIYLVFVNLQCIVAMVATVIVLRLFENEQRDLSTIQTHDLSGRTHLDTMEPTNEDTTESETDTAPYSISGKVASGQSNVDTMKPTNEDKTGSYKDTAPYSISDKVASRTFRRLAFLRSRVAPMKQAQPERRSPAKKRRRCLKSSTLDIVFFFLFHFASLPIYYLIFEMKI